MSINTKVARRSEIKVMVELNEEKQPVGLQWLAQDAGLDAQKPASAMLLAIWDKAEKSTMRIDLWTHEMSVEEMEFFMYETLASMADTYERSTSDSEMAKEIKAFAHRFGKEKKVIK
ncbi:MAG: gliding motility protein GldC [Bacteroidia bacterium]|jgi:gliding motility-associated protein GldC